MDSCGYTISHEVGNKILTLLSTFIEKNKRDVNLCSLITDSMLLKFLEALDEDILMNIDKASIHLLLEWLCKVQRLSDSASAEKSDNESTNVLSVNSNSDNKKLQDNKKLHLGKEIMKITWECTAQERGTDVEVVCCDGTVYTADIAIVTVPLHSLNHQEDMVFIPSLPTSKKHLLKGVPYSTSDKMSLTFPHKWWPEECHGVGLLWNKQADYERGIVINGEDWFEELCLFVEDEDNPNVLFCPVYEKMKESTQYLSDDEVCNDIMDHMNSFAGKAFNIPQPVGFRRSDHASGNITGSLPTEFISTVENALGREVLLFPHHCITESSPLQGSLENCLMVADFALKLCRSKDAGGTSFPHISAKHAHICKAIIIGAGISGLSAAKTLIEGGMQDIVILEAQEYAGGRICSVPIGDSYLEAGAQWIHGQNNEIFKLAKDFNLLSDVVSAEGLGQYIRDDGVVLETSIVFEVEHVVSEILKECESFVSESTDVPLSIGHYLQQKFSKYLENCTSDSQEIRTMKEELFDWHIRFHVIDNSCSKLDTLSAKFWGKFLYCGGEDYVNFKQGYSSLIKCIIQNFPDGLLKLKTPVVKVRWKTDALNDTVVLSNTVGDNIPGNKYVEVLCEDGSLFCAEHVIITSSLGFLKRNYKTMFQPLLPERKIQAIKEMGFSAICKIFLIYEEPWWSPETKGFQLIWSKCNYTKPSREQASSWVRDLTGFDVVLTQKAVLLGWAGGDGAILVENLPEAIVGEHCTELLRKFTKRNDIPPPKTVYRTQWHNNRFVCGGYSNTSTACDTSRIGPSVLLEPVYTHVKKSHGLHVEHPSLLFAGEAAHECYFSTTHGAYETGKSQAEYLLKYLNKSK